MVKNQFATEFTFILGIHSFICILLMLSKYATLVEVSLYFHSCDKIVFIFILIFLIMSIKKIDFCIKAYFKGPRILTFDENVNTIL